MAKFERKAKPPTAPEAIPETEAPPEAIPEAPPTRNRPGRKPKDRVIDTAAIGEAMSAIFAARDVLDAAKADERRAVAMLHASGNLGPFRYRGATWRIVSVGGVPRLTSVGERRVIDID